MDFKSLLAAEISKKRKVADSATSSSSIQPENKYIKRSVIETARISAYRAEEAERQAKKKAKEEEWRIEKEQEEERERVRVEKKSRLAEESEQKRRLQEEEKERKLDPVWKEVEPLDDNEIREKLKEKGEPRVVFGEDVMGRRARLVKAMKVSPKDAHSGNDLVPDNWPASMTDEEMKLVSFLLPKESASLRHVNAQIYHWFILVLSEWDKALASRPKDIQQSFQGLKATDTYNSAHSHVQVLLLQLRSSTVPSDVFPKLVEIVYLCQQRKYVSANDVYLKLSIGNAAWPIGVTMVGIHERSAREKLHEKDRGGHLMSDDATRKVLQGIKRCMSFAQTRWVPEDIGQIMG